MHSDMLDAKCGWHAIVWKHHLKVVESLVATGSELSKTINAVWKA
jgi:hypothetical protein